MVESGDFLHDGKISVLKGQLLYPRDRSELPNHERHYDFVSDQQLMETQKALGIAELDMKI